MSYQGTDSEHRIRELARRGRSPGWIASATGWPLKTVVDILAKDDGFSNLLAQGLRSPTPVTRDLAQRLNDELRMLSRLLEADQLEVEVSTLDGGLRRLQGGPGGRAVEPVPATEPLADPLAGLDGPSEPARRPGPRSGRGKLTAHRDEIIRRYQAGEPISQMAKAFNCTPPSLYDLLRRAGVYRSTRAS